MADTYLPTEGSVVVIKLSRAEVLIFLARLAYFNVFNVSSYCRDVGEMHAIITVLQLPAKESLSNRVNLESLYGICIFEDGPRLCISYSAFIQFPSARSDRFILAPSIRRIPRFCVYAARSEPARSIKLSLPANYFELSECSTVICKTA